MLTMLTKIKADIKKHWVSWVGFIGLVAILPMLKHHPEQALLIILFWLLICFGFSIAVALDRKGLYRTDEEINKPYV